VCAELDDADLRILSYFNLTFKLTLCYCNLMKTTHLIYANPGVFSSLCDLKRFQTITGNKDHSAIIRTEIN